MLRTPRAEIELPLVLNELTQAGEGAPPVAEKVQLLQTVRAHSKELAKQVDQFLIEEIDKLRGGLLAAQDSQGKLKALLETLTAPPWHPAIFLGLAPADKSDAAMILFSNARRVVSLAGEVDAESLEIGDEVLLSHELNAVVGKSPYHFFHGGEVASFDRYMPDRRLVLKCRDEEIVVDSAGPLRQVELKNGDHIRWDRNAWIAFEKIDVSRDSSLFLEETPAETFEDIGGLDRQIEMLQRSITLHIYHSNAVRKYRLRRKGSALLVGPPGTGKTMMARALASWLAKISPSGRARFMNIKPASLNSMWYSQSEANYREAFRIAREAGEREPEVPVVMFFDEVDSVGASRGAALMRVDDRVLTSFMTELDGLESRGNILVVAASNRRDAIDPALLRAGRLGDMVIDVPRPKMKAASDIFARHLHPDIPYSGGDQAAARQQIIDSAVAAIYSPNGAADLATLTFRDGKRRVVRAADMISGSNIANIVLAATEEACAREVETGEAGIMLGDLLSAIAAEFESAARALTPANCLGYLSDLPRDVDVVSVEPVKRLVPRPHLYLSAA